MGKISWGKKQVLNWVRGIRTFSVLYLKLVCKSKTILKFKSLSKYL